MLTTVLAAIDLDTILQVGVFLFIIISTLAGQIFSKNQKRGAKGQQKPRPRRPRREPPDARGGQKAPDARPQAQPWNDPVDVRVQRERPLLAEPVMPEVVQVEAVRAEPLVVRESVAEHVQRHIDSGGIESSRLQSQIEQADERMASHLHEAFDHRLGRLEDSGSRIKGTKVAKAVEPGREPQPAVDPSELAARVVQMIRNPADLSAAIVLNEILKRPEERWNE